MITDVGKRAEIKIPKDARVIDCTGKTIVAGFWNSHVHLTEAAWNNAANAPAAILEKHMQEMLTRWGFTTVWDLGSDPEQFSRRSAAASNRAKFPAPEFFWPATFFRRTAIPFTCLRKCNSPKPLRLTKPRKWLATT